MTSAQTSKIVDRVRKLLGLSRSSNPNEASAAAEQAASLMKEHGLSDSDVTDDVKDGSEIIDVPVGSEGFRATWRFALMTSVARAFRCEAVGLRVGERRKVRVVGRRDDVAVVARVFRHVAREVELLTVEQVVGDSVSSSLEDSWLFGVQAVPQAVRRESFRQGAAAGVAEQLVVMRRRQRQAEVERSRDAGELGLAVVRPARDDVRSYMASKFGRSKEPRPPTSTELPPSPPPSPSPRQWRDDVMGGDVEDAAEAQAPEDFLRGLAAGRSIQIPIDEKQEAK